MSACVKISRELNYTLEDILTHSIDWINQVLNELLYQEMEDQLLQMAFHGIKQKDIKKYRRQSEKILGRQNDIKLNIADFGNKGLSIAKDNKTRVKR